MNWIIELDLRLWCVGAINLINAVNDYANEILL
ncbi:TPA: hypothetical protein NBJ16_001242 [Staphylococcus aureus]|nr:hypothetical protein [Staphylococcus aureus]MBN4862704.1 hypothetical protein [Staphylococcus sp. EG-SA-32]ELG8226924.1 hypothetical protein [Staphylococcus aureus]MBR9437063.1 hypothetical protein [Staphylococcus aureus]MCM0357042.1 hypothetical protein [Staphylococcus aureus]MCM0379417.1 hypothetical protein [Staphylococcus aureus]